MCGSRTLSSVICVIFLLGGGCTADQPATPGPLPELPCTTLAGPDDPDSDGDRIEDACDNCPVTANAEQADTDHDGVGDACTDDVDGDGFVDEEDNCPELHHPDQDDSDGDGVGDACDACPEGEDELDSDGDGFDDCVDICPGLATETNEDRDGDGVGDDCDVCPDVPDAGQVDRDGDGIGDACDPDTPFMLEEATISELHGALLDGSWTCEAIVELYLDRIRRYDLDVSVGPPMNAIITINPQVRAQARALDEALASAGELVGPLHCVPVVLKTNFDTADMPTTNGSLALTGVQARDDGFAAGQMRSKGAILLATTAMDEFAAGVHGIGGRSGRTGNAYDHSRNSGGSSAGSAVAVGANLAMGGTGTDNCASLTLPASYAGLVTIRSTLGLVSLDGVFPSGRLDAVAGPMARNVRDVAALLDAMAAENSADGWQVHDDVRPQSYLDGLETTALQGARIGVVRKLADDTAGHYLHPFAGGDPGTLRLFDRVLDDMESLGATIVENVTLPGFDDRRYGGGWYPEAKAYFSRVDGPIRSLEDMCRTGRFSEHIHATVDSCLEAMERSEDNPMGSYEAGKEAYDLNRRYLEAVMDALELDALVYPTDALGTPNVTRAKANCIAYSVSELPVVSFVAGYRGQSPALPAGMLLMGRKFSEGRLLAMAYAFEQGTGHRRPPEVSFDGFSETQREPLDIAAYNDLHLRIAEAAWEQVLADGAKFDLNDPTFRRIAREVLAGSEFADLIGE